MARQLKSFMDWEKRLYTNPEIMEKYAKKYLAAFFEDTPLESFQHWGRWNKIEYILIRKDHLVFVIINGDTIRFMIYNLGGERHAN